MAVMKSIISGTVGGAAFITFLFVINAGPVLSIVVAGAAFGGSHLILRPLFNKNNDVEILLESENFYRTTVKEGKKKFFLIQKEIENVKDLTIRKQGMDIIETLGNIFKALEEDPKDVKVVRELFTIYLDAPINILQKFNQLSKGGIKGDVYNKAYTQVTENLDLLNKFYDSMLHKIMEDEYVGLDIDLQTLNEMLKMEGIQK